MLFQNKCLFLHACNIAVFINILIKVMAILTLEIENRSAFEHLKSVLGMMRGVKIVETPEKFVQKKMAIDVPNAVTMEAMREAESGQDAGKIMTDSLQSFVDSIIQ